MRIPSADDWRGYEKDLDARSAYKRFFGKSNEDLLKYFGDAQSIERASELSFMPRSAFQYYVFAFAEFIKSKDAIGDPDSASCFLRLLIDREEKDPGGVASIFEQLKDAVDMVARGQCRFRARVEIYGRFSKQARDLIGLVNAGKGTTRP
jgi:hypothetical protein